MLQLSQRDRGRLHWIRQAEDGELTATEAARRAGISRRQFHRWLTRYRWHGDRAVIHRGRGKSPI